MGYVSGKVKRRLKMPPSHAESSGPMMLAFQINKLSSLTGAAEQPSGGLSLISFKSVIKRFIQALVGAFTSVAMMR